MKNTHRNGRLREVHFYEWSVSRWKASTTRLLLDAAGRGIYRDLLDTCYTDGYIPKDPSLQALICGTTIAEIERVWVVIKKHFVARKNDDSALENLAANLFRKSFFQYRKKQRENGEKGGRPKSIPDKDIRTTGLHSVNPRENQEGEGEGEEEGEVNKKESEREKRIAPCGAADEKPPPAPPLNSISEIHNGPFEQWCAMFTGPIEGTAWKVFGTITNTPERLHLLMENTPLWMKTKSYADGFFGASKFLTSEVWLRPPAPALLSQSRPATPTRKEAALERVRNAQP